MKLYHPPISSAIFGLRTPFAVLPPKYSTTLPPSIIGRTHRSMTTKRVPASAIKVIKSSPAPPPPPAPLSWQQTTSANASISTDASMSTAPASPATDSAPPSPSETSTSCSSAHADALLLSNPPTRLWGSIRLSLPDGIVTAIWSPDHDGLRPPPNRLPAFERVLRRGTNLLEVLQGKGAQTLLLNAFCGHSKRRMYARLHCGANVGTRPFELQCEFTPVPRNPSVCSAEIQILCLERAAFQAGSANLDEVVFTTRHNASCAIIYLDPASIPYLGHFPSEITGKSLFSFIHSDDVPVIQRAHQRLHETNGALISTPSLRLVTHGGSVLTVDSEWSAFVNPWTRTIEMIVGRHCVNRDASADALSCEGTSASVELPGSPGSPAIPAERFRELDASIYALVNRPTPPQNPSVRQFVDNVVDSLVERQQIREEVQAMQESQPILSYNQINCLENVHRLLKSQSRLFESLADARGDEHEDAVVAMPSSQTLPLTEDILMQHNKRCESECKDAWRKRLSLKRTAPVAAPYAIKRSRATPPPPLPVPPPTPVDQSAWNEYVRIVQLHLQNMTSTDAAAVNGAQAKLPVMPMLPRVIQYLPPPQAGTPSTLPSM